MTIKSLFPASRPSLDLNFAKTKRLDPRITFSRSSTATYTGSDGLIKSAAVNEARFDHSGAGESLGLLVEEARTNVVTYSNYVQNSAWTTQNAVVIPNTALAPDGTFTAAKLVDTAVNGVHSVYRPNLFSSNGTANTRSIYVKGGERRYVAFGLRDTGLETNDTTEAIFDTQTGSFFTNGFWVLGRTAQSVGNGWWRLSWYDTQFNGAIDGLVIGIASSTTTASLTYTGDGASGIYIWGAQLEAGSFPTSYIPTPATFTGRTSTATFYDSAGVVQTAASGVARSDAFFPDSSGAMRPAGLLLEAAGTNLLTYSEDLTDASWVKGSSTVTGNAIAAPDGTVTADKLVETTAANTTHVVSKAATTTAATHTFSVYLKKAERSFALLYDLTNAVGAYFNLDTGVISTGGSGIPAASAYSSQNVGNGWWRCSITTTATSGTNTYRVYLASSSTVYSYTGDGTSGIYVWGAQLEASPYPTSYIPTVASTVTRSADTSTSATVTRSADVAQITGTNFSSWYNANEGTAFVSGRTKKNTTNAAGWASFFQTGAGTTNRISIRVNGTDLTSSGSQVVGFTQAFPGYDSPASIALAYKANDFALDASYQTLQTDTSGSVPSFIDQLQIGNIETVNIGIGGTISRLAYYPARLPDATLQALTAS